MSVYVIFNNIPSASGGFAPRPPPAVRPWTPLGDFRPPEPPIMLNLSNVGDLPYLAI